MYQTRLQPPIPKAQTTCNQESQANDPADESRGHNAVHIMIQTDMKRGVVDSYPKSHSMALGIAQLACGFLSVILALVSFGVVTVVAQVGHGIWGAILSLVAGSLGIAAAYRKTKSLIISHMVISILSACFVWGQIFTSIVGSALDSSICLNSYENFYFYYRTLCAGWNNSMRTGPFAVDILLIIVGFVQFLVAVWSASFSCRYVCCSCCKECCCICYPNNDLKPHVITSQQRQNVSAEYTVPTRTTEGQSGRGYERLVEEMEPPNYDDVAGNQNKEFI